MCKTIIRFTLGNDVEIFLHAARVVASQAVVVGHAASFFGVFTLIQPPHFFYIQNIGVVFFFFLSGFVISYSCNMKKNLRKYSFNEFLFDRLFRLHVVVIPAIVFILACDITFQFLAGAEGEYFTNISVVTIFGNLLFLQDYPIWIVEVITGKHGLPVTMPGTGRPFWTLAVEFWLYIFFGFLYLSCEKRSLWAALSLVIFLFSLPVVFDNSLHGRGNGLAIVWFIGVSAMFSLKYYGAFLRNLPGGFIVGSLVLLLLLIPLCARGEYDGYSFRLNILFCAAFFVLLLTIYRNGLPLMLKKIERRIVFTANYSFTLYATHYTVLYWLHYYYEEHNGYILFFSGFLISNIIAIGLAACTEMRYKMYRDWFKSSFFFGKIQSEQC